jgi:L-cysteine:1D-myo-inositol 2-amino-2-deoxy-alpha-D-glucopyranoside ligase
LVTTLRAALANDLDTTLALSIVDDYADAALAGGEADAAGPALMATAVDALLGVRL